MCHCSQTFSSSFDYSKNRFGGRHNCNTMMTIQNDLVTLWSRRLRASVTRLAPNYVFNLMTSTLSSDITHYDQITDVEMSKIFQCISRH